MTNIFINTSMSLNLTINHGSIHSLNSRLIRNRYTINLLPDIRFAPRIPMVATLNLRQRHRSLLTAINNRNFANSLKRLSLRPLNRRQHNSRRGRRRRRRRISVKRSIRFNLKPIFTLQPSWRQLSPTRTTATELVRPPYGIQYEHAYDSLPGT